MASANCDPTPTLEHMTVVEAQSQPTGGLKSWTTSRPSVSKGCMRKGIPNIARVTTSNMMRQTVDFWCTSACWWVSDGRLPLSLWPGLIHAARGDLSKGPYTVFSLPPLATGLPSMPKLLNIAATSWASIGILVMPKWLWSIVQLALTASTLVSR